MQEKKMGTHIMTRTYASPSLGAAIVQETPLKKNTHEGSPHI